MKNGIETHKEIKAFVIASVLLSFVVAVIYAFDFYFMTIPDGTPYSDVKTQIGYISEWHNQGYLRPMCQTYPLYYVVIRALHWLTRDWTVTIMIICVLLAFVSNLFQILFIRLLSGEKAFYYAVVTGTLMSFVWPISFKYSFFGGEKYPPMYLEQVFLTSGATAPTHNLTYLCVKPFALIALYLFIKMLREDDRRKFGILTVAFSIALFGSVVAKPNFYQAFAPAGVIIVFIYLIRNGWGRLSRCFAVAGAYLPATLWVIHSMTYNLSPYRYSLFEGINMFGDGTPVWIVLTRAVVYSIFVVLCLLLYRQFDMVMLTGVLTYVFGAGEFLCLIEVNEPEFLSMSWGYYIAMYVVCICAVTVFYKLMHTDNGIKSRLIYVAGNALLGIQAAIGLAVFILTWLPWWREYLAR